MPREKATPEQLLQMIKEDDKDQTRGRLKIFFGYAAGVGKTYAMLKAAHLAKRQGIDVVVGYIEPHSRPETMELLEGLEVLPPLAIAYKGIQLREFDLDTTLARKPQLVLVDELAHTNAAGCRHLKRYQDIKELLNAGINVYTTVNVQHIESLNDIVASITGVMVRERIPDHVFDEADQVELVDIEPADLISRLNEGKIYKQEQAQKALGHFFTVENLIALREIALRRAADRVNRLSERAKQVSAGQYYTEEHILVCLSSSPSNGRIIRTAARMANAFKGLFTAIYVKTPSFDNMSAEDKTRLHNNIHLAEQLGAKIETAFGDDVAFQIAEFAKYSGVSKIVLGRSTAKKRFGQIKQTFTEQLTNLAPDIDIYIIPDKTTLPYKSRKASTPVRGIKASDIIKSLAILAGATLIGFAFHQLGFSEANIIIIYILSVLITAIATSGRIYSIVSALLGVLIFNFFFTYPHFTFSVYDSAYPLTFAIMFIVAFITGDLATRIKAQAKQSAKVAYRTNILLETSQLFQQKNTPNGIAMAAAQQLHKLLNKTIIYYAPGEQGLSEPQLFTASEEQNPTIYTTDNEKAVAEWVYKNNKHAGATTNTLGSAKCLYLAIRSASTVYGVFGIALKEPLEAFENSLVLSILGECALAMEKELSNRKREEAAMQAKNEQLRANLLRSISHDLRTPLTSISGNASVLLHNASSISDEKKQRLYNDIYDDSMWLINLVENLLAVTKIEDSNVDMKLQAELIEDVIAEALRHISSKGAEHYIQVIQSDDLLMAKMNAQLIIQVIINIIDNAVKYTPPGSTITISSKRAKDMVVVAIADNGPGVTDEDKDKLFDMFYSANNTVADSRRGMGLGLALCKSIITAHKGTITVRDNVPHGTIFSFTLPAEEVKLHE